MKTLSEDALNSNCDTRVLAGELKYLDDRIRAWRRACVAASLIFLSVAIAARASGQAKPISVGLDDFVVSEKNQKMGPQTFENNGKVVNHLGRSTFRLGKGLAYARDVEFQNGTIDVDMAADSQGQFLGVVFRAESDDDFELIFFRPGASGTTDAVQYTPGLLGANAWQIYTGPGNTASADFTRNKWIHVRIVVAGLVARLYLDNSTEPAMVVPDLKRGYSKGSIGFWAHSGGGYFSNLTYTPDNATYSSDVKEDFLKGTLVDWQLSQMFDAAEVDAGVYPNINKLTWEKVRAENPGMVVINRYRRSPNFVPPGNAEVLRGRVPGSKFVFAKTTIHADRDEIRKMNFGYSDEAVVYLNSKPIYAGKNEIGFREPKFLGLMNVDNDAVYLDLKKGDNELVLAVTEFFGGWGFICKLAS